MSEEVKILKEILDNSDIDNYTIDDNECYLNAYARKCLKKVLDQLQQKDNIIKEVREYIKDITLCKNKHQKEVPTTTFCDEGIKLIFRFIKEDILEILDKAQNEENK